MGDPHAVPVLKSVLIDATREPIVRHEAAEALAAIADPQVLPLLRQYVSDPVQVITSYDTFSKHDLIRKVVLYKSAP
jgi:deoxyhypusine monooxygenase